MSSCALDDSFDLPITALLHIENSPHANPNVSPFARPYNIASHVFMNFLL